ncbi:MAG TPA: ACT domain-containing protein [Armatimonadota bacterium]|jgi:glycine cleavage system transcriptional repressor
MTEQQYLVVSGLGPDRPGIVAATTRYLTEHGANVEDSRAVVLGGEFGLMVLASGTAAAVAKVQEDLAELVEATGLQFQTRPTVSPEDHRRSRALPYRVEANALDHEGIVQAVAEALYAAGINIVSLETTVRNAPVTGTELFSLVARVDIPDGVAVEAVRASLAAVARAQCLDVEMRPE